MFRVNISVIFFVPLMAGGITLSRKSLVTTDIVTKPDNCTIVEVGLRACNNMSYWCTTECLRTWAEDSFCTVGQDQSGPALRQHAITERADSCRSQGFQVDNFRLQLSPAQNAFLQKLYIRDRHLRQKQTAFFALQVTGGHIGLGSLVVFSVLTRKIHRNLTFFNFCISWIFSSVIFCLLLYHGTEGHTFDSPYGDLHLCSSVRCIVQASLINGVQVMTSCSTMALVIQLWLNLRISVYGVTCSRIQTRMMTAALLLAPYIFFVMFAVPSLFIAQNAVLFPAYVNIFYCHIQSGLNWIPLLRAVYGVTVVFLLITFGFDALIIRIMYLHWQTFRRIQMKGAISLSALLRVVIFSLYRVAAAVAYTMALFSSQVSPASSTNSTTGDKTNIANLENPLSVDILQATIPLVAFLVLGINKETIKALIFLRKERGQDQTEFNSTAGVTNAINIADARDMLETPHDLGEGK